MTIESWLVLIGVILLAMGITAQFMRRLPITNAMAYLAVGFIIGPTFLHLFHFNPLKESAMLERITEMAVILSVFTAGLKMPVPVDLRVWRYPLLLGIVSMALTAALIAAFGYYALGLPLGAAVLLGGVLAPTDPVLARDVQVRHAGDRDHLRFGLTCEAGINDGTAFPIIMLGLGLLGLHGLGGGWRWALVDVLWATSAGVVLGVLCGWSLGRIVWALHRRSRRLQLLDNFLGLGLIALVYGASLLIHAYGFIAVFAAAVALRHTEFQAAKRLAADLEHDDDDLPTTGVIDRSLLFKEQLEHLSEIVLILIIGGTLFLNSWNWPGVLLAVFVFLVARPLGVWMASTISTEPPRVRLLTAWFGIRGIGSLYYLMYAIEHGLSEALGLELIQLVLVVVTLSILVHGVSVKPLMRRYQRAVENDRSEPSAAAERKVVVPGS
ncbi:MAG: cation:proton antiporter [Xanthomonadales bacterium]|nr:cation:proton antiporter [Xanthomonadales bacterium]